ncbi:hypothetical protein HYW87_03660 [Candidatus Roizmanbacteria bacterium]|nr:hypothetical protein [Candidatus Roizmanbacteria bacterium]
MSTVLFVDGENFLHKVKEVLADRKIDVRKVDLSKNERFFNDTLLKGLL